MSGALAFRIRASRPDDAAALHTYHRAIESEAPPWWAPASVVPTIERNREYIDQFVVTGRHAQLLALGGRRILGLLDAKPWPHPWYRHTYAVTVSVLPDVRGRGIGRALAAEALSWAEPNPEVWRLECDILTANRAYLALAESFGLRREGTKQMAAASPEGPLDVAIFAITWPGKAARQDDR